MLISIVDDDVSFARSAERLLRSFGYDTEVFASASDFFRLGRIQSSQCLILDCLLPSVSGLELQRCVNKSGFRLPIVFVTGGANLDEQMQALRAGAVDFLRKPVDDLTLMNAVKHAIRRSSPQISCQRTSI